MKNLLKIFHNQDHNIDNIHNNNKLLLGYN